MKDDSKYLEISDCGLFKGLSQRYLGEYKETTNILQQNAFELGVISTQLFCSSKTLRSEVISTTEVRSAPSHGQIFCVSAHRSLISYKKDKGKAVPVLK